MRSRAACAWIDACGKAKLGGPQGCFLAGAGAAVYAPMGDQAIEGRLIGLVSVVLPEHGLIRCKAEPCEGADDVFACARNVPGRIDVFDANEPDAVVGARIEKARHGGDKTACMKGACGRGGEPASVGRHGAEEEVEMKMIVEEKGRRTP